MGIIKLFEQFKNEKINIVLFGPPGVGKGTQASKLVEKYGLVHLSTGDIFRYNIEKNTPLGKLAKQYMDKGELVPDNVTIKMLENEVTKYENPKGFIFDGFPRTIQQANSLEKFLESKGTNIKLMFELTASEDELVNRILLRAKDSGREDDSKEEIIRNRIKIYHEYTSVVADFYKDQNKYVRIEGNGIDDVFDKISNYLDN